MLRGTHHGLPLQTVCNHASPTFASIRQWFATSTSRHHHGWTEPVINRHTTTPSTSRPHSIPTARRPRYPPIHFDRCSVSSSVCPSVQDPPRPPPAPRTGIPLTLDSRSGDVFFGWERGVDVMVDERVRARDEIWIWGCYILSGDWCRQTMMDIYGGRAAYQSLGGCEYPGSWIFDGFRRVFTVLVRVRTMDFDGVHLSFCGCHRRSVATGFLVDC